jgi:HEAT repeat protein
MKRRGASKSRDLEATLASLSRLREDPHTAAALAELRHALSGKSSHAATKAAQIIGEFEIAEIMPDLLGSFDRFLVQPEKSDPGCAAKTAIAEAAYRIGAVEAEAIFLRGVAHVQMEPVWGGKADTAPGLRGVCALGLVRINHREALAILADLLADPDPRVRAEAARAIAYSEDPHGAPLVRLKARLGDESTEVTSECLIALLRLDPAGGLPVAAGFLDRPDALVQEAAALALGSARVKGAFEVLHAWWERTVRADLRRTALLSISMLKREEAFGFLLSLIATANAPTARDAISALRLYRHDDALVNRVRATAMERTDVDLSAALGEAFDAD